MEAVGSLSTPQNSANRKLFLIGGVLAILLMGFLIYLAFARQIFKARQVIEGPKISESAKETSFSLTPSAATFLTGDEVRVSIIARSDADAANLFVVRLKFPSDLLEAQSINLQPQGGSSAFIKDWFISNWVENVFDNTTGSVSLVGGVPAPGLKTIPGQTPILAELVFKAKKSGPAVISFDNTTAIYRNLDNANILTTKREVTFKIIPSAGEPSPPPSLVVGDLNQDGKIDLADLSVILTRFGQTEPKIADLNSDGIINSFDYSAEIQILAAASVIRDNKSESVATASGQLD